MQHDANLSLHFLPLLDFCAVSIDLRNALLRFCNFAVAGVQFLSRAAHVRR